MTKESRDVRGTMALPTPLQAFSAVPKDQHDETQTITDGEKMTGAQALVRSLEDLGIEDVFGVPGGAILPVYDEIKDDTKFHFMLMRHEQAAGHAAEGYALTTGKVDAWVVDNEVAVALAAQQGLTVLDEAMTSEPYAFAFAKGSDELVSSFNASLKEIIVFSGNF